jgi:XFP N-terminal domain
MHASESGKVDVLNGKELSRLDAYWRAANYLSVGQIYLLDNPLLRERDSMGGGGGANEIEHQPHATPQTSDLTIFRASRINDRSRRRCSLASAVKWPCRKLPLRLPEGAPLPGAPPCIRHLLLPRTAGD